jgi:glucose-6-phosphate-specific signal transduction histidine kinase
VAISSDIEQIRLSIDSVPGVILLGDVHLYPIGESQGLAAQIEVVDWEGWPSIRAQVAQRLLAFGISQLIVEPLMSGSVIAPPAVPQDLGMAMALRYEQQWQSERQALADSLSQELSQHTLTIKTLANTIESRLAHEAELGSANASLSNIATLLVGSSSALFDSLRAILSTIRTTDPDQAGLLQAARSLISDTQLSEPKRRIELFLQPEDQVLFGMGDNHIESLAFRLMQSGLAAALEDPQVKAVIVSLRSTVGVLTVHVSDDGQAPGTKFRPLSEELNRDLRAEVERVDGIFNLGKGDSGGFELWVTLPWPGV